MGEMHRLLPNNFGICPCKNAEIIDPEAGGPYLLYL